MVPFDRRNWFAQHVLVHEARLRGYLRRYFKASSDISDGVQETYARLLSLADDQLCAIRLPHAFLFAAARNVALEWTRRERIVCWDPMAESLTASVLDESPSAYDEVLAREERALLARAIASLPARCRRVLTLRKLYGVPQKEIAARLGISENTVEKHTANGVRLCAEYLEARRRGARRWNRAAVRPRADQEPDGQFGGARGQSVARPARPRRAEPGSARGVRALALR